MARKFILVSIPEKFMDKFKNLIKNINILNEDSAVIEIEKIYDEDYVATPKKGG